MPPAQGSGPTTKYITVGPGRQRHARSVITIAGQWRSLSNLGWDATAGKPDKLTDDDQDLVGKIGRISLPVPPNGPGEVMIPVRGGVEAYAAWSDETIAKHTTVVVVELRSPRSVTVTPFPEADSL